MHSREFYKKFETDNLTLKSCHVIGDNYYSITYDFNNNKINTTISLIIEQYEDEIFIKTRINNENNILKNETMQLKEKVKEEIEKEKDLRLLLLLGELTIIL
jgi:hypothetical protein